MERYNVAVVGATGVVGQKFLEVLEEYDFPIQELYLFASKRSAGTTRTFRGKEYTILELTKESFKTYPIDIALFSAGGGTSLTYAPLAAREGVTVIDNSSAWRMNADVPLIVPEVNADVLTVDDRLIANPNCSTIQSVVALYPIEALFHVERVHYTTYQAVSGSGSAGIVDLENGLEGKTHTNYPHPIASNVLPHIDVFLPNGYTKEEIKMVEETKKIMNNSELKVTATCVRVPVFNGHSVAMSVTCKEKINLDALRDVYAHAKGIVLLDIPEENKYPTPHIANGTDDTYIGRLRVDLDDPYTVHIFCSADNIRKGAASNTIQIAQVLIDRGYIQKKS